MKMKLCKNLLLSAVLGSATSSAFPMVTVDFENGIPFPITPPIVLTPPGSGPIYTTSFQGLDFRFDNIPNPGFVNRLQDFVNPDGGDWALETVRTNRGAPIALLTTLNLPSSTNSFSFQYSSSSGFTVDVWSATNVNIGTRTFGATFSVAFGAQNGCPTVSGTATTGPKNCNWQSIFAGTDMALQSQQNGLYYGGEVSYITFRNDESNDASFGRGGMVDNFKMDYTINSAVPEPSSYALTAIGILVVGVFVRRRTI